MIVSNDIMISRFTMVGILIQSTLFDMLPTELVTYIIELALPYRWVTFFNVSRYSVMYRSSLFQKARSIIPSDTVQVRYYCCNDSIQLCCGKWKKLAKNHSTVVFALGSKVPKWLWLLRDKKECFVI